MDRQIIYPGAIQLAIDLLQTQVNVMISLGFVAQSVFGTGTVISGLGCIPTSPASMAVTIQPGCIISNQVVDTSNFSIISLDTADQLVKVGINLQSVASTALGQITAPSTPSYSQVYVISVAFSEQDTTATTLSYYNAAQPSQPYSGPNGNSAQQNTQRLQRANLILTAGTPASTGTQVAPSPSSGTALYQITVAYGATTITSGQIVTVPGAPFVPFNLQNLRPGVSSGIQTYTSHGTDTWTVPNFVTQCEVEVWGGGSGSWASISGFPGGGGSGGGYAKKRLSGLTPGASITVTVGAGGTAGSTTGPTAPGAGGTSSFAGSGFTTVSATGGSINTDGVAATAPTFGNKAGVGSGGDLNLTGHDGGNGGTGTSPASGLADGQYGGVGGGSACGGSNVTAGGVGVAGYAPGGGASGAGTGASGTTAQAGAAGADGMIIIRW